MSSKKAAAALMSMLGSACSCSETLTLEQYLNKKWLYCGAYDTDQKDNDGDIIKNRIGVNDARIGCIVFHDIFDKSGQADRQFVKWFECSYEAIEFAVDMARAERAKYPQQS